MRNNRTVIIFPLSRRIRALGDAPLMSGSLPLPAANLTISGTTLDETGTPLSGCTVYLFDMTSGVPVLSQTTVSDGSGFYSFSVGRGTYWAVDYKVGTPDKAGASVNTLTGI